MSSIKLCKNIRNRDVTCEKVSLFSSHIRLIVSWRKNYRLESLFWGILKALLSLSSALRGSAKFNSRG